MLVIAFFDNIVIRLLGITLASLSSGTGEISFLSLTHYYDDWALNGFSSGTGAAGLVGSFVFMVLTTWMGLATKSALILFSLTPWLFAVTYAYILPPTDASAVKYQALSQPNGPQSLSNSNPPRLSNFEFVGTINRIKPLVIPFMIPLMVVYIGEYTINQGISPTLLFPLDELPFARFRDVYVTYGTLYQRKFPFLCIEIPSFDWCLLQLVFSFRGHREWFSD
jgi:battenin